MGKKFPNRESRAIYIFMHYKKKLHEILFKSQEINMKKSLGVSIGSSGRSSAGDEDVDDETSKTAIASYQAREDEIERRKMEVRERVESQLTRAEEEAKRLTQVWAVSSSSNYSCFERIKRNKLHLQILSIIIYFLYCQIIK